LTILNLFMGVIFLVYFLLFLVRIVAIWILAIFAPLAFFAYIFPKTEKFFGDWLKNLLNWSILGVVTLFLMGLGLNLFFIVTGPDFPAQWQATNAINAKSGTISTPYLFNYIFLIVYLIVAFQAAKKLTPKGAEIVWRVGELALGGGTKLAQWGGRTLGQRAAIKRQEIKQRGAERIMEKMKTGRLSFGERLRGAALVGPGVWARKPKMQRTAALAEARAAQFRSSLIEEQRKALVAKTKDLDEDGAKAFLRADFEKQKTNPLRNKHKTAALYKLLADKTALNDSDKGALYKEAWKAAGPGEVKNNPVKKAVLAHYPQFGTPEERKVQIERSTSSDIEKWDRSAKENDDVIKDIINTRRADLIAKIGSQTKVSSDKVQAKIGETIGVAWESLIKGVKIDPNYMQKLGDDAKKELLQNLNVVRYLHLTPLGEVQTWKKYGTLQKGAADNVENLIEKLRKSIK